LCGATRSFTHAPQGLHIDLAARDDERHSNLAARRVGAGHDRGIGDRGMLDERR
jgi:hypothetical protein